jgi:hypothetical protein
MSTFVSTKGLARILHPIASRELDDALALSLTNKARVSKMRKLLMEFRLAAP